MAIYTAGSVGGFGLSVLASYFPIPAALQPILGSAGLVVGASAPLFGLLGALVWYGKRSGSSDLARQIWSWVAFLGIFGLLVRGVDNWAHLGGFLGGYLASRWLDPLKPESLNHLILGAVCLVATLAAVVATLLSRAPVLP
jgi:rhomboid protease GluP